MMIWRGKGWQNAVTPCMFSHFYATTMAQESDAICSAKTFKQILIWSTSKCTQKMKQILNSNDK